MAITQSRKSPDLVSGLSIIRIMLILEKLKITTYGYKTS